MNPFGQTLLAGRYQVLEKLGQGGMGEVYKGLDTHTEKFVAIKQLRGTISDDKTVIERFRREGQALSDLNHPNIVKMLDMIQQDEEYFLITEFLGGGDLAHVLTERGKLPLGEALRMGLELADALSRAHHLGIIHRDIKPANVLIANDGTPRLTDFGVAHVASEERLTGTGMAVGTMDYLPPEAVNGEAVDVRADVWSFGVMLYEMLTGERPFLGSTTMQLLSNILTVAAPDIRNGCPEASAELNELIQQLLQKERNQRIRSVRQVGAALEAILEGDESGLRRLQTPSKSSTTKLETLEDRPTTPGIPRQMPTASAEKAKKPRWGRRLRRTKEHQARNNSRRFTIAVALLAIIAAGGGLFLSFGTNLLPASPTTTPSPSPEPTATSEPIPGDAPDGYRWEQLDELEFLVPRNWIKVPDSMIETYLEGTEVDAGMSAMLNVFEQQRVWAIYVNWTNFHAVVVMIEDVPIALPDEAHIERAEDLAEAGNTAPIEEMRFIETRFGRGFFMRNDVPATADNPGEGRLELYSFSQGNSLYSFAFTAALADWEAANPDFAVILESVRIGTEPEITHEATENIPDGYEWETIGDVRFLVPEVWINMPIETFMELSENVLPSEEGRDTARGFLDLQSEVGLYGSLLDFSAVVVMIEDSGIVLPEVMLAQRLEELIGAAGSSFVFDEEPYMVETHLGDALYTHGTLSLGGSENRTVDLQVYLIYQGTKLYNIGFSTFSENVEENQPIFETIFNSVEIVEEEALQVPNMPDGWKIVEGEHTAYAVPAEFITSTGANQTMMDASLNLVFGNAESANAAGSLFEQMDFDGLAANLRGTDLMFVASIYQESVLSTDLGAAESIVQGMFSILAEGEELQYTVLSTRREILPVGEVSVTDTQIIIPERPAMRNIYYLTVRDDGMTLYAFATTFLDSEAERMLPITEQIAQTFVILD